MAHPKHQAVRLLYDFRCGYFGVAEMDVGGELTVDHFHPVSAGGDDSDENLVYACMRCNLYKGALLPGAMERDRDQRLLHPLRDNLSEHFREDRTTGRLESRTVTGAFHITALQLNRPPLIANRQRRWQYVLLLAHLDQSEAENAEKEARLLRREAYIRILEDRMNQLSEKDTHEE